MDVLTPEQRRRNMAAIRSKHTKPEMAVRSMTHGMGYRYALHRKDLAGHPDLVLTKHRKIIFVHGCFWHMHTCRYGKVRPATNTRFWDSKREGNVARDKRNLRKLRKEGWKVLVIWECQTRHPEKLTKKLADFLSS